VTDPYDRILGVLDRSRYFFFQVASLLYSQGSVNPFQIHYFSENMVAPGIEPGHLGLDYQPSSLINVRNSHDQEIDLKQGMRIFSHITGWARLN
jgi:hypothetical protein